MRAPLAVLAFVTGCSFHPGATRDGSLGDGASDTIADAAVDDTMAAGDTLAADAIQFCNAADLDLRACFAFEGNTLDGSSYGNNATSSTVTYPAGHTGLGVGTAASSINVPANSSLNFSPQLTLKMWIKPNSLPGPGARMGLVDSSGYRMFVETGGTIRCALDNGAPDEAITVATVSTNVFTRVACTYDGANLRVFINGAQMATKSFVTTINAVTPNLTIGQNEPSGDNFDGTIDELQIWNSLVSP